MDDFIAELSSWVQEEPQDALYYLFLFLSFVSWVCFVWAILSSRYASSLATTTFEIWFHKILFGEKYANLYKILSRIITIIASFILGISFFEIAMMAKAGLL